MQGGGGGSYAPLGGGGNASSPKRSSKKSGSVDGKSEKGKKISREKVTDEAARLPVRAEPSGVVAPAATAGAVGEADGVATAGGTAAGDGGRWIHVPN